MTLAVWLKIISGFLFGLGFTYGYHVWQLRSILKHPVIPTKQHVYRAMIPRILVMSGTIFLVLLLIPEPKFPFLLAMVVGMIGSSMILLRKLTKLKQP